jgi:hypothetical protein
MAYVIDAERLGFDNEGKLIVFHSDQRDVAIRVEELIEQGERAKDVLGWVAQLNNIVAQATEQGDA